MRVREEPTSNYIICADTYKRLEQSTLIKFFEIFPRSWGIYQKQKNIVELKEGGTIFIRSLDDSDALEGIPDVRAAWMDEGGKTNRKSWINFQGRLARRQGQGLITTTPYAFNWLYSDFYQKWIEGDEMYDVIQFKSTENPTFPEEEFDRLKNELPEAEFKRKYCGTFSRMHGLVFELPRTSIVEKAEISGLTYYLGIDWGYTNPCAMVVIGVDKDGNFLQVDEFYKNKQTTPELLEAAERLVEKYEIKHIYADPEDPEKIQQFNRAGMRTIPANNDWEKGRNIVNIALNTNKYKIVRKRCPNTLKEFELYHYPEPDDERAITEKPVDANNHALSGVRYIMVMAIGGTGRVLRTTSKGPKTQKDRIEKLLAGGSKKRTPNKNWYYN